VRALPDDFDAAELYGLLADGWSFHLERADYAAVGGGSYHWVVTDLQGRRAFVTLDDLDNKPWLGDTRDAVFDGLRRAFDTAGALRNAGLAFVVAPILTNTGETLRRAGPLYTVALFPFVAGRAGTYGRYDDAERAAIQAMLAELHQTTPAVRSTARRLDLDLPGRRYIESALEDLNEAWSGGPLAEPARRALATHAADVAELLALFDRLRAHVAGRSVDWVVTHGEPHAANVMRTGESYVLVDWDTVALAPPERDLWMLARDDDRDVDRLAVDFFRITWDLEDIAAFTNVLRSPHRESADTRKAYDGLTICAARASSYH
jgi:spectinomycin phosphotransferase